ncbi:MAG: hypothetical protein IJJ26_01525 [Victivallales bacterium]|nr:hypothetical protein [Victivallales bacterium]
MNSTTWFAIVAALAVSTVISFSAMKRMSRPLPKYDPDSVQVVEQRTEKEVHAPVGKKQVAARPVRPDYDSLWKKTLFKDTRTEEEAVATDPEITDENVNNSEFELVGLMRVGPADAAQPVAIIVKKQTSRPANNRGMGRNNPGMPGGFPGGGPGGNRMGMGGQRGNMDRMGGRGTPAVEEPATQDDRRANRTICHVGDKVGKSDYVVKSISTEENKVVLVRGSEVAVLTIDVKNERASVRRENVQKAELEAREKIKQAEQAAIAAQPQQQEQQQQQQPPWARRRFNGGQNGNWNRGQQGGGAPPWGNNGPPMPPGMNNNNQNNQGNNNGGGIRFRNPGNNFPGNSGNTGNNTNNSGRQWRIRGNNGQGN